MSNPRQKASLRVWLVDDHAVVRQGLQMFLATDGWLQVVGQAENGREALDRVAQLQSDLVLMDLLMPVMDGVSAISQIKAQFPEIEMREALTPRETEILRMVGRGLSNKRIAQQLELSELTVKTHVSDLLSKLGLSSRTQAALFAIKEGLTGLE